VLSSGRGRVDYYLRSAGGRKSSREESHRASEISREPSGDFRKYACLPQFVSFFPAEKEEDEHRRLYGAR